VVGDKNVVAVHSVVDVAEGANVRVGVCNGCGVSVMVCTGVTVDGTSTVAVWASRKGVMLEKVPASNQPCDQTKANADKIINPRTNTHGLDFVFFFGCLLERDYIGFPKLTNEWETSSSPTHSVKCFNLFFHFAEPFFSLFPGNFTGT